MKKIKVLLLLSAYLFFQTNTNFTYASTLPPTTIDHVKLSEIVKLSAKDLQKFIGKKLNLRERISFNITKSKMKNYLKHHADITLADYSKIDEKKTGKINWFWLSMGALAPILGKLIVYLIADATSAAIWIPLILAPVIIAFATKQSKKNKKSVLVGALILISCGLIIAFFSAGIGY